MRNATQIISTVGALVMAATPVLAVSSMAHAADMTTVRIQTNDLDLSQPSGETTFDQRVSKAAHTICASSGHTEMDQQAACERDVRDQAQAQFRTLRTSEATPPAVIVASR